MMSSGSCSAQPLNLFAARPDLKVDLHSRVEIPDQHGSKTARQVGLLAAGLTGPPFHSLQAPEDNLVPAYNIWSSMLMAIAIRFLVIAHAM